MEQTSEALNETHPSLRDVRSDLVPSVTARSHCGVGRSVQGIQTEATGVPVARVRCISMGMNADIQIADDNRR